MLHSSVADAELWKCAKGVYRNAPTPGESCTPVNVGVECQKGRRVFEPNNTTSSANKKCPTTVKPVPIKYAYKKSLIYDSDSEVPQPKKMARSPFGWRKPNRGYLSEEQRLKWQKRIEGDDSGIPSGIYGGMENLDIESIDPSLAGVMPGH